MADTLPEAWLLFIAEREGKPIAASLIALATDGDSTSSPLVAYGRYWGAVERVDYLHFGACYYQPLAWCIAHGVHRFEGGAQGEHKMARALMPVKTTSAHWLAHPAFADAVERFLEARGRRHRELHGPPGRAQPEPGGLSATARFASRPRPNSAAITPADRQQQGEKSCHSSAWVTAAHPDRCSSRCTRCTTASRCTGS